MAISAENFLKNPQKYINDGVVILSADEYEKLDTLRCVQQGKAEIAAGNFYTKDEAFQIMGDKVEKWKKK